MAEPHRGRGRHTVLAVGADQAHVNGGQHADPGPVKFQAAGQPGQVTGGVGPAVTVCDLGGQDPLALAPAAAVRSR
jgi:hypothetical protein